MDIVASIIISVYVADKTQNSILKMPWFHTPASHFSQNRHCTISNIAKQQLEMTASLWIVVAVSCPFIFWNADQTQYQGNFWGTFYIPKGEGLDGI